MRTSNGRYFWLIDSAHRLCTYMVIYGQPKPQDALKCQYNVQKTSDTFRFGFFSASGTKQTILSDRHFYLRAAVRLRTLAASLQCFTLPSLSGGCLHSRLHRLRDSARRHESPASRLCFLFSNWNRGMKNKRGRTATTTNIYQICLTRRSSAAVRSENRC